MGSLQEFYQAIPNEDKEGFLHILHGALKSAVYMICLQSAITNNTSVQEDIRTKAIRAAEALARYRISDPYHFLRDAGLLLPPPLLQIGAAIAHPRNAHEGSSESGSSLTLDPTTTDGEYQQRSEGGSSFTGDASTRDGENESSSGSSGKSATTDNMQEDIARRGGCPMPPVLDAESEDT